MLEKGNRRVTRYLRKGAMHWARQRGEENREKKVRYLSRERCRSYIDRVEAVRRQRTV